MRTNGGKSASTATMSPMDADKARSGNPVTAAKARTGEPSAP
jgi:hypothetical protein